MDANSVKKNLLVKVDAVEVRSKNLSMRETKSSKWVEQLAKVAAKVYEAVVAVSRWASSMIRKIQYKRRQ